MISVCIDILRDSPMRELLMHIIAAITRTITCSYSIVHIPRAVAITHKGKPGPRARDRRGTTMVKLVPVAIGLLACCTVWAEQPSVWVASPWQHVLRDSKRGSKRTVTLQAARHEYEPFRIIISGGDTGVCNVNVIASDLVSSSNTIAAQNLTLFREHYVHLTKPSYHSSAPLGWYPDALIPFVNPEDGSPLDGSLYDAVPFDVAPATNQGVWVDVYVPADTPPDKYRGTVTVMTEGELLGTVPIKLTVWDFTLPQSITMRSNFGAIIPAVASRHGMEFESKAFREVQLRYVSTLLDHRCVPDVWSLDIWPHWNEETQTLNDTGQGENLRRLLADGRVNALRVPEGPKTPAYLKALTDYLRQHNCLQIAYFYLFDEPNNAEQYARVRREGELIHTAAPGLKTLCTEQTVPTDPAWGDLYGYVDIWCPLWTFYDEETARQRQDLGEEIWSYTALTGAPGVPWWEIDSPPVMFRAPFWTSWHYGLRGFLYWSSVCWQDRDPWTNPLFSDRYWGEGQLLYPGIDAGIDGPVPSIRLKLIREAMEDYEYMALAAQQGCRQEVDAIVDKMAPSFYQWEHDPRQYLAAREKIARLILKPSPKEE